MLRLVYGVTSDNLHKDCIQVEPKLIDSTNPQRIPHLYRSVLAPSFHLIMCMSIFH